MTFEKLNEKQNQHSIWRHVWSESIFKSIQFIVYSNWISRNLKFSTYNFITKSTSLKKPGKIVLQGKIRFEIIQQFYKVHF